MQITVTSKWKEGELPISEYKDTLSEKFKINKLFLTCMTQTLFSIQHSGVVVLYAMTLSLNASEFYYQRAQTSCKDHVHTLHPLDVERFAE